MMAGQGRAGPMRRCSPSFPTKPCRWTRLQVPNPCSECDALIAATALVHGLTVVTRNTADFVATDVALIDPWQSLTKT